MFSMAFKLMETLEVKNWTRWETTPNSEDTFTFWFENADEEFWYWFQDQFWWIPVIITAFYWVGIYWLQNFMKNRLPVKDLTYVIVTYNFLMTLFSVVCLWRISGTFFSQLTFTFDGLHKSICERFQVHNKDFFWTVAIAWSKTCQLLDTVFVVLKKKPIEFFPMYHHSVVVLTPHMVMPYGEPMIFYLGITNELQHAILYMYFTLKALKIKLPKFVPSIILVVELVQMVIGLAVGLYTRHVTVNGGFCVRHPKSIAVFNFVYFTFLILVLQMAYRHFISKRTEKKKVV